jgi:hypothetical protein
MSINEKSTTLMGDHLNLTPHLKTVHRVAGTEQFVAFLVCLRNDGSCLLEGTTGVRVEHRGSGIWDNKIVGGVEPDIRRVERLAGNQ